MVVSVSAPDPARDGASPVDLQRNGRPAARPLVPIRSGDAGQDDPRRRGRSVLDPFVDHVRRADRRSLPRAIQDRGTQFDERGIGRSGDAAKSCRVPRNVGSAGRFGLDAGSGAAPGNRTDENGCRTCRHGMKQRDARVGGARPRVKGNVRGLSIYSSSRSGSSGRQPARRGRERALLLTESGAQTQLTFQGLEISGT